MVFCKPPRHGDTLRERTLRALTFAIAMWFVAAPWSGCASSGRSRTSAGEGADGPLFRRMQADRALRAERFDEAISVYQTLLEGTLNTPLEAATVQYHLSMAYWARAGRGAEAEAPAEATKADRASAVEVARAALKTLQSQPEESRRNLYGLVGRSLGAYLRAEGALDEAIDVYLRVLNATSDNGEDRVRTLYELGNAHFDRSNRRADHTTTEADSPEDLNTALRYLDDALNLARQLEGCPPILLVSINNSLGLIHNVRLQPALAVERFTEAERLCREHDIVAAQAEVLQNLVLALIEVGRYDDARTQSAQLQALPAAASDPRIMAALGLAQMKLGDLSQAREQFDLARHLARQDPDSPPDLSFMAQLACNAAAVAQALGEFDEAERYLQDAQRELASGGVDPRTTAVVQANLGRMYLTLERLDDAEVQLETVLQTLTRLQGPRHPDTLLLKLDLANLARARGHLAEAQERGEEALRGLAAALGRDHPQVALARMELATLYRDQQRCSEAVPQARRALETLDTWLGPSHRLAVLACLKAALIAADCRGGDEDDAAFRDLQTEAGKRFAELRNALGPKNVEVLGAMVSFADLMARTPAAYATALERYRKAEEGFREIYGDGAQSLAALRLKQGQLLARMERYEEALDTYDRALRLRDRALVRHPICAELLAGMGDVYDASGQRNRAVERWHEALRILTAAYGADHPRVRHFTEHRRP